LVDSLPATATASGSGGAYTLGPVSGLPVGTDPVTAAFSGCSGFGAGSGTLIQQVEAVTASPTPTPTPTATATATPTPSVTDPTITARLSSAQAKRDGWYRDPVRITFTCTPGSAPLAAPCPAPASFSSPGASKSATRTITDTDGGTASVTVTAKLDFGAPTMRVVHARAGTCRAYDPLSGTQSCVVHKTRRTRAGVSTVHWVAIATDRAGNVEKTYGVYKVKA
jgi:adhesin/invasin